MNKRIETNFKELKEYEEIECYYDYLEQAEHFFRDVFGDRVESQKYIIRANKEIERLNKELEEKEAILGGIQQLEAEIERLKTKEEQLIRRLEDLIIVGEQVENEWAIDICKMVINELKGSENSGS